MKQLFFKLIALCFTMILCLLLAEPVVRLAVDPVNYLLPLMVPDERLHHRIQEGSGGHDDWGFRNTAVPETVEIIAVGDSQTYGNTAAANRSWPAWLARETGRSVYNFGIGGWGPYEYLEILRTRGLELSPEIVVVGLYLGNDIFEATRSVYGLDHWANRRHPTRTDELFELHKKFFEELDKNRSDKPIAGNLPGSSLRNWLRRNSVFYRMTVIAVGHWLRPFEVAAFNRSREGVTIVNDPEGDLLTVLGTEDRFKGLDLADPLISEGLRLTLDILPELRDVTKDAGGQLVVLIIPTKIRVFADYTRVQTPADQREAIDKLVTNEEFILAKIERKLQEEHIPYASAYEALKSLIGVEPIYPRNVDGHPRSAGYRVIAKVAAQMIADLDEPTRRTNRRPNGG